MSYKKIVNMKNLFWLFLLTLPFASYSQTWIDDSNFEDSLTAKHAFGDDETDIVVIEFWAKFNEVNAFADWDKLDGVTYYRVDIAKAPNAKKEYRVRMAPTLIIFKDGVKEEVFKAGLDLLFPASLEDVQDAIEDIKQANKF